MIIVKYLHIIVHLDNSHIIINLEGVFRESGWKLNMKNENKKLFNSLFNEMIVCNKNTYQGEFRSRQARY